MFPFFAPRWNWKWNFLSSLWHKYMSLPPSLYYLLTVTSADVNIIMATERHVYMYQVNCSYKLLNIMCYIEHLIVCAIHLITVSICGFILTKSQSEIPPLITSRDSQRGGELVQDPCIQTTVWMGLVSPCVSAWYVSVFCSSLSFALRFNLFDDN